MKIIGTGSALPKTVVTNADMEKLVETSDEWIRTRTGIQTRHIAEEDETVTYLSVEAAKRALDMAKVAAEDLDLILCASVTADHIVPMLSCEVQAAIGAVNAFAFDINAGCTGFLFALATAAAYMSTGRFHRALVVGADNLSKITNWEDRSTCVLFGDGAGAAVLGDGDGILGLVQGSDGSKGQALLCGNRPQHSPFLERQNEKGYDYVYMDGQAVYRFAVKTVPQAINKALEEASLTADDISIFLLHQANLRIIDAVAKRLGQPMEKFPTIIEEYGNISAASIPILMDRENRAGHIKPHDKVLIAGFGAGLTWGACVIDW